MGQIHQQMRTQLLWSICSILRTWIVRSLLGWPMENDYWMLDEVPGGYGEVKAGCLLRHHFVPRRGRMNLQQLPKDHRIPVQNLDQSRVTVLKKPDGKFQVFTGVRDDNLPPVHHAWTGITVFQINSKTRREMAMYTKKNYDWCEASGQKTPRSKKPGKPRRTRMPSISATSILRNAPCSRRQRSKN